MIIALFLAYNLLTTNTKSEGCNGILIYGDPSKNQMNTHNSLVISMRISIKVGERR